MDSQHPFIPAAVVASSAYLTRCQHETKSSPLLSLPSDPVFDIAWTMNINELPVEMLMFIFETAYVDTSSSLWAPALLKVSHVCHRWRQAALQCEQLWSYLPLASTAWTDECLLRCTTAPLEIHARDKAWRTNGPTKLMPLLAHELHRSRSLSICIPEDSSLSNGMLPDVVQLLNSNHAPLLEDIMLSFRRYTANGVIVRAFRPNPLFLDRSLAKLSRAGFVDAIIPLERFIPSPNIRCLELINSMIWSNTAELLEFFQAFPQLEELVFIYDKGAASVRQFSVNMTVSEKTPLQCLPMRCMKKLVYHAPPVQMATTFSLMELPSTASLMLTYDDDRWTQGPALGPLINAPLAEWLGADAPVNALAGGMIDPLTAFPVLSAAISAHFADTENQYFPSLVLDGRELCASTTDTNETANLPSYFHVSVPYIGAQSIESMLSGLPVFLKAPSLTIKPPRPYNRNSIPGLMADEVYHLFHLFSGISELKVHGEMVSRFIEHYKRVGPRPAFPNLESLRICDADLAQDVGDPDKPRLVMNDLLCAIFRPGRVSEWMEYLVFERCTINEADVALLRKGVESELNVEDAELELIGCTIVTDDMFAEDYIEDV